MRLLFNALSHHSKRGKNKNKNKKFDVCLNRKYVENKRDPRGIDRQRYGAAKCQRRGGGANAYRLWLYSLTMTLFFFLFSPISSTTKARFSQVGLDARDAQHRQTNGTKLFFKYKKQAKKKIQKKEDDVYKIKRRAVSYINIEESSLSPQDVVNSRQKKKGNSLKSLTNCFDRE